MDSHPIIPYLEPIYRFCRRRLAEPHDAEDLAAEIVCHILEGMDKYAVANLDAWVWRIAHNRYARFIDRRARSPISLTADGTLPEVAASADTDETEARYAAVFRALHTLSRAYRDLFVDYYLGEQSVRDLATKYDLPETTVKWRLDVGRKKIRARIGENHMEKIYHRLNWNTTTCNGSLDPDRYLHSQAARAICAATYDRPLTVEEISLATGLPALYVEDELPRLEYGDAIVRIGQKYATNFILLRIADRRTLADASADLVEAVADCIADRLAALPDADHLGYIFVPYLLRQRMRALRKALGYDSGPFPPRKDGGYGWFVVEETADETEADDPDSVGCCAAIDGDWRIYCHCIGRYHDVINIGRYGIGRITDLHLLQNLQNLDDNTAADLIARGLLRRDGAGYAFTFPTYTSAEFTALVDRIALPDDLDATLADWISATRAAFAAFVPRRLEGQINQYLAGYLGRLIGQVIERLIDRGVLRRPDPERPMADGVFAILGDAITP